jgi:hypothetical protein
MTREYNQFREATNPLSYKDPNDLKSNAEVDDFSWLNNRIKSGMDIETSGNAPANTTPPVDDFSSLPDQKNALVNEQANNSSVDGVDNFDAFSGGRGSVESRAQDTFMDANTNAIQNNNPKNAVAFRAAEARRAGIENIATTSVDTTTFAGRANPHDNFSIRMSDTMTPVLNEKSPVAASRQERLAQQRAAWRAAEGRTVATNVTTSGVVIQDGAGRILLSSKKGLGLVGSEIHPNTSNYNAVDQGLVRANDSLMQQKRLEIISSQAAADRKAAFDIGNSASKENQNTHGKYGNITRTWKQIGYFTDIDR